MQCGVLYSWGTNSNGECGINTTGTITAREILFDVAEISAGNGMSIIKNEAGEVYVFGNNANGQIGLDTVTKQMTPVKITLTEDVKIETISAGESTHSGLVDENGYVWHTGTNAQGELGILGETTLKAYTKTGSAIVEINQPQKVYLSIGEEKTIESVLKNTFNLKVDIIDNNQQHFAITASREDSIGIEGQKITVKDYGETTITVTHIETDIKTEFIIKVVVKIDSLVQGFRDLDLDDGDYEVAIQDQVYIVELKNIYGNTRYSLEDGETTRIVSLGDASTEYKTLVVKYHGDLNIDKGVTVTANTVNNLTYKKGMYLCVLGNIYNDGEISMTARGTYNVAGENVWLWKNIDGSYEYVPAVGANRRSITVYKYTWSSSKWISRRKWNK
ncbi:MAG: hypothetical protein HFJ51_05180 [Clostridia bacterium]|nr:hypothetical protein [Clostridia bacterium]